MRKIVLNLAVTLDGFIEGPNGEIDWCSMDIDPADSSVRESFFDQFLESIDTIFYGRISYDNWGQFQPAQQDSEEVKKLWRGVHSKKKFVFSTTASLSEDSVTLIRDSVPQRVAEIKAQPGKDIWLYGGSSLIATFMQHDLIDRYLLAVHPVVLGSGKPLFSESDKRVSLRLKSAKPSRSGVVLLDYEKG